MTKRLLQPIFFRFLVWFFALSVLSGSLKAQMNCGLKLGVNFSNPDLSSSPNQSFSEDLPTDYSAGYQAGLWIQFPLSSRLYLNNEFTFSQHGHLISDSISQKTTIKSVSYTVLMRYEVANRFLLELGPQIGKNIFAEREIGGDDVAAYRFYNKGLDAGLNLGVLYEFDFPLSIGIRYHHGINDISDDRIPFRNEIGQTAGFIEFEEVRRNFQLNVYYRLAD